MILRHANKAVQSQIFLSIGGFSLVIGLVLYRFAPEFAASDFLSGMLVGISIVMNIAGLWLFGRSRREDD